MLESLGALEVMWMRMNVDQTRRLALFCANEAQMIQKLQVELPGYLALLPIFFVSSHVFLSTTVLITVAITIERYQVEKIFFSTSLVIHITVLITCPTIIAIYQIKHVSPSCHIQTNISTVITTTNITFLNTATTRHFAAQLNIASGPTVPGQLWQDMLALP